jgi:hypothetical protein
MLRRWCITLATMALVTGTCLAAGSASAATLAAHGAAANSALPGFNPGGLMAGSGAAVQPGAARVLNPTVESTNWSGYAATGATGAFSSVSASWTQPTATCPSSSAQYSSFWVGLDGFNSGSVEQTGTDSDCAGTRPSYYGWYEMFPAAPVTYSNPVAPGDQMSASVTFSGTTTYTLVLTDHTRGWTRTVTRRQAGLARSSAEVITEAPSSNTGAARSSSGRSAVVRYAWKKSAATISRRPRLLAATKVASSATATDGSSAAGSACARLPPTVPLARMGG